MTRSASVAWEYEFLYSKKRIDAVGVDNYGNLARIGSRKVCIKACIGGDTMMRKRNTWREDEERIKVFKNKVEKVQEVADTRNWRPKHVTAAPVGLGPAAEPMVGRSLAGAALQRCNAAYAPSSLVYFAGLCALQAVDAALENPVIRSWLQICRSGNIRRWRIQKLSSSKQANSWREWKTSFKWKRWD